MGWLDFLKKDNGPGRDWAVIEVGDADFKQQVLQRSHKMPVMVDFWAAWCGPCRALGPILEDLAADPHSKFVLAKLDTEHNRQTAAQYQISSIPAVKIFRNGHVIGEFIGARPGALVKRFVNQTLALPAPGPTIAASDDPVTRLAQAKKHLQKGRGYEAFVLLDTFPDAPERAEAEDLLPMAQFMFDVSLGDVPAGPEGSDKAVQAADQALRRGKYPEALAQLAKAEKLASETNQPYFADAMTAVAAYRGIPLPGTNSNPAA